MSAALQKKVFSGSKNFKARSNMLLEITRFSAKTIIAPELLSTRSRSGDVMQKKEHCIIRLHNAAKTTSAQKLTNENFSLTYEVTRV